MTYSLVPAGGLRECDRRDPQGPRKHYARCGAMIAEKGIWLELDLHPRALSSSSEGPCPPGPRITPPNMALTY